MQEPVPAQEATLTIPFQNLLDLPEGAGYRHRDGRASVDIRRQGDSLAVTGHCDSLMRRCLFYEEEVFRRQVREDSLLQTVEFYKQELVRKNRPHCLYRRYGIRHSINRFNKETTV